MNQPLLRIAIRLTLCAAFSWLVWRALGPVAMVMTLPLVGITLARPLIDLASDIRHQTRALVWHSSQGRYYAYRGIALQVLEDARHTRWIRAEDVRRIVGSTTSDGALALTYPDGWQMMGNPMQPHFSDVALIVHLRKDSSAKTLHFRQWAEREIAFPARRTRERLGIKTTAADSTAAN
jgi:hypothetical protein